jgi:hypothetical protein
MADYCSYTILDSGLYTPNTLSLHTTVGHDGQVITLRPILIILVNFLRGIRNGLYLPLSFLCGHSTAKTLYKQSIGWLSGCNSRLEDPSTHERKIIVRRVACSYQTTTFALVFLVLISPCLELYR